MKPGGLRVLASKPFMRFARRFGISKADLLVAISGPFDADLGSGLYKFRLARTGVGKSGGARALVALRAGTRAVLMFGFEKKDQANIGDDELKAYRKAAKIYLAFSDEEVDQIVKQNALIEIAPTEG